MKNENVSLSILKSIACFSVVMIHCTFPGVTGKVVSGLARFAVPLFFAISGYYVYSEDQRKVAKRLPTKIEHIGGLLFETELIYFVWHLLKSSIETGGVSGAVAWLRQSFTLKNIINLIVFQKTIVGDVSWFLVALLLCYVATIYINKVIGWGKSFYLIPILLMINIFIGEISPFIWRRSILWYWISNFWLLGFPCYVLGYWIRINEARLKKIKDRTLIYIILCSAFFNVLEIAITDANQFFIASIPLMVCCMILCIKHTTKRIFVGGDYGFFNILEKDCLLVYI